MSDFSFMRSGLGDGEPSNNVSPDFMRMVVSLMALLCEEALGTAATFAKACGRKQVTPEDTILALKYESHFFWDKDIDDRFMERLSIEREHTYETDDDESDESDDETAETADEDEVFTDAFVSGDRELYDRVLDVAARWDTWNPDDVAKRMLKSAIDKTERQAISCE